MKRIIAAIMLGAALFAGAGARAQDFDKAKAEAGTLPGDRGYFYDLLFEKVARGMLGIFGAPAQLKYDRSRIAERQAEAIAAAQSKGALSDEAFTAVALEREIRRDAWKLVRKHTKGKDPDVFTKDLDALAGPDPALWLFDGDYNKLIKKEKDALEVRKEDLRKKIAEVRGAGGSGEIPLDMKANMEQVQKEHDEFVRREAQFRATAEIAAEQAEDLFEGREKAAVVLIRPEPASPKSAELWNRLLAALDSEKKKPFTVQRLVELLKTGAATSTDEINKLAKDVQGSIRADRIEAQKLAAAEEAKKALAAEQKPPEAPKKPAAKPRPAPAPAPKKQLEKIPSETVATEPLTLTYYQYLDGQVGTYFSVQYSGAGGLPPYHFQLESGVGFPPLGLILDVNGKLSGTPKIDGNSTFSVCVVDTAGESVCAGTLMRVAPAYVAPPPPPPAPGPGPAPAPEQGVPVTLALTSRTCSIRETYPDGSTSEWVNVAGTASGPVGTRVRADTSSGVTVSCGAWQADTSWSCTRGQGAPENVQWSFRLTSYTEGSVAYIYASAPVEGAQKSVQFIRHCNEF